MRNILRSLLTLFHTHTHTHTHGESPVRQYMRLLCLIRAVALWQRTFLIARLGFVGHAIYVLRMCHLQQLRNSLKTCRDNVQCQIYVMPKGCVSRISCRCLDAVV